MIAKIAIAMTFLNTLVILFGWLASYCESASESVSDRAGGL